jgi:DNA-binding CsgD family transcriptional regulator
VAETTDGSDAIDQRMVVAALMPRLAEVLTTLSPVQRDVLLLYAWGELSHEEIATALEIAPGTVRSRLSRARATLRDRLGDPATVALDLRTAVIGMLSLQINEPGLPWPPFAEQADRFLARLVGLTPPPEDTHAARPVP